MQDMIEGGDEAKAVRRSAAGRANKGADAAEAARRERAKAEEARMAGLSWPDAAIEGYVHVTSDKGTPKQYWVVLSSSDARLRFFDSKSMARDAFYSGRGGQIGVLRRLFRLRHARVESSEQPTTTTGICGAKRARSHRSSAAEPTCTTRLRGRRRNPKCQSIAASISDCVLRGQRTSIDIT